MKVHIYSLDGKEKGEITLPNAFKEKVRLDLIKRAVLSDESYEYQPKGNYRFAGMETSADYFGRKEAYGSLKNRGQSKLPREILPKGRHGKVKRIPSAVKGRRAHPPKPEKNIIEKMNKKEYIKALKSALAATREKELVLGRGHIFEGKKLPIIIEDKFEELSKTKDVVKVLEKLDLYKDVERAKEKTKKVSRRNKSKYVPKSLLIVVNNGSILKAASNLPGVDVVNVRALRVKDIAPGTHPARLTIFSESAIKELENL